MTEVHRGLVFARVATSSVRTEVVDGRSYLVAPVVAVREGVLNGEFVPAQEIEASVPFWNDVPVTVDHPPVVDGQNVSARNISLLERIGIGRVYGGYFDDSGLKGEMWIEIEKAKKTPGGKIVLQKLESGAPLEVSTAYFCVTSDDTGIYNGIEYARVQHNLRPDHLAALPASIGACSWSDGCGAPRVNKEGDAMPMLRVHLLPGESYQEREEKVIAAVRAAVIPPGSEGFWAYIADLYENTAVYKFGWPDGKEAYYQVPYAASADGSIQLGQPMKVDRSVSYSPTTQEQGSAQLPKEACTCAIELNIRGTARTPSYSGTESTAWSGPTLAEMVAGYVKHTGAAKPASSRVADLPAAAKTWIANRTLLGDSGADAESDLIFFPVVNPSTDKLNENALKAVISGRGSQANIPQAAKDSAQSKARGLLEKEFGMEAQEEGIVRRFVDMIRKALGGNAMSTKEELIQSLREKGVKLADDILENADEALLQELVDHYAVPEDPKPGDEEEEPEAEAPEQPAEPEGNEVANTVGGALTAEERRKLLALLEANEAKETEEHNRLVASLVANKRCTIPKESLNKMDATALKALASAYEPGSFLGVGVPRREPGAVPVPPAIVLGAPDGGE